MYVENVGNGEFKLKPLPIKAQFSTVNAIESVDINQDGNLDVILTGNQFDIETQSPRLDASNGLVLLGDGNGNFNALSIVESGFFTPENAKSMVLLHGKNRLWFIVGNNDGPTQAFLQNNESKIN